MAVQKVRLGDAGKAAKDVTAGQMRALKRAAVRTLTRAAGIAQDTFMETVAKDFKAPVAFTTNKQGYRLGLARMSQQNPASKFGIMPKQSAYLAFTIEGGLRKPGDAGTSKNFAFVPTKGTDAWPRPLRAPSCGGTPRSSSSKAESAFRPGAVALVRQGGRP